MRNAADSQLCMHPISKHTARAAALTEQQLLHAGPEIHHFDLYRLQGPQARMDLAHSFASAVSLVEWPERLPADALPDPHLAVRLERMTVVCNPYLINCRYTTADRQHACSVGRLCACTDSLLVRQPLKHDTPVIVLTVQAEQVQAADSYSPLQGMPEGQAADEYEDHAWRLVSLHSSSQDWQHRYHDVAQLLSIESRDSIEQPCLLR